MRRLHLRALLLTAVLAACVLGWSASADARPWVDDGDAIVAAVDPDTPIVVLDGRNDAVEQSSIREVQPAPVSDSSRAGSRPNGNANAAFLAAFVLAGVAAVLVAAASRVSSG
jgi:hypothetical protein